MLLPSSIGQIEEGFSGGCLCFAAQPRTAKQETGQRGLAGKPDKRAQRRSPSEMSDVHV